MSGLVIDLFAGGGGASVGIERALGRPVSLAINHDPAAVQMHEANHPQTEHRCESIYAVDPRQAVRVMPVDLLHASPSCTHFSRARGGTPISRQERGLGWMILRWAALVSPTVIICENVPEWVTWGPVRRGRPQKSKSGRYFKQLCDQLRALGYVVEHRVLNAAEFGAPTTRKRLFLIARCDGLPITWPAPSHGPKASLPYRTAAECIDWTDLGKSIFERKKPLAEATCRRIAAGIVRYVIEAKRPFIVTCNHGKEGFRGQSVDEPFRTLTASRDAHGLVSPVLISTAHDDFANRNGPRSHSIEARLGVVAKTNNHALMTAFLAKHYTGVVGQTVDKPLGTVTAVDHHSVVACHLTKFRQNAVGSSCDEPVPTITSGAGAKRPAGAAHALGLVGACMLRMNFGDKQWNGVDEPLSTVTAQGGHHALCTAFLTTYYSGGGSANGADQPVPAIVTKARHGLVTVDIDGTTYALTDIRLRMLKPKELARAQGFPADYLLTGTQAQQIGRIGNAVCPDVEEALVRANVPSACARAAQ